MNLGTGALNVTLDDRHTAAVCNPAHFSADGMSPVITLHTRLYQTPLRVLEHGAGLTNAQPTRGPLISDTSRAGSFLPGVFSTILPEDR